IRETFGKIITEPEIRAFEAIAKYYFKQTRQRYLPEYWVPIQWAVRLVQKAGLHGNMPDPRMIGYMFKEIGIFRDRLQHLEIYSSLMMPLVYTQVSFKNTGLFHFLSILTGLICFFLKLFSFFIIL
ncbi:unnamed protein product, partial [Rodentolepis nana]|uniref:Bestrophin homolog n=1 Tax=Rodentolepis nana TaxID=102285 RepID=A0A0R3TIX7_RODNA